MLIIIIFIERLIEMPLNTWQFLQYGSIYPNAIKEEEIRRR